MFSRRRFLQGTAGLGATAALAAAIPGSRQSASPAPAPTSSRGPIQVTRRPRHIIHLVADGMSLGTLTCADHLSRLLRQGRGLTWVTLLNSPTAAQAWMDMRSLNSLVTDSAAASSSWGSGSRVINGSLNQLPDGRDLRTLYELFAEKGWRRGLVTTTEITHATPAGFAANVGDRDTGARIALQYLQRRIDLLLGGGRKFFDPAVRRDKRDLAGGFRKAGYHVMATAEELDAAPLDRPWLGTFGPSHLPFTIDHQHDPAAAGKVPTLARMTSAALRWLERHEHFILQIEGGRVDQACHNCDIGSALRDLVAFDEALDVALAFQRRVPDTLVVITTDHGNGNPGLNGLGDAYGQSPHLFANLLKFNASFPRILAQLRTVETLPAPGAANTTTNGVTTNAAANPARGGTTPEPRPDDPADESDELMADDEADTADDLAMEEEGEDGGESSTSARATRRKRRRAQQRIVVATPAAITEAIRSATGYRPGARKVEMLAEFLQRKGRAMYNPFNSESAQLGLLLANHTGLSFTGHSHTSDYVPLTALGPGSELFRGFLRNTDLFRFYTALAQIRFENPTDPWSASNDEPRSIPNAARENTGEYLLG